MATTTGVVDQDFKRLLYKKIQIPIFPLDNFKTEPILKAVFR